MRFYLVHFKTCSHGDPYPCRQPKGYISCGTGWTLARKSRGSTIYPYQVIGSDDIIKADEFDDIRPIGIRIPKG